VRAAARVTLTAAALASALLAIAASPSAFSSDVDALERAVAADPENLQVAADYRQRAISDRAFDRSIDLFERLAKRKGSGPGVQISLAFAYVDKVPTSGDIRRLYLGRDAMNALTKSIALRPTVLAYYVRGVINLFYNAFIFHRADRGVADLTTALGMVDGNTPQQLVLRVYTALGDGYVRLQNVAKAREMWTAALAKFPRDAGLKSRLSAQGGALEDIVTTALTASRRLDTSLNGLLPLTP
jgi:tetratricopeptide (TPR) repeat protein